MKQDAYPDLDAWAGGGTQPVPIGTEAQAVDDLRMVKRVQMTSFVQIP